jgi:FKBP-type peptidyl-prolyl cis-trans isomerase
MDLIRKGLYLLLCVLVLPSTLTAEKISNHEAVILSKCFESILNCEAGYVLFGKKPVCILEYKENSFYFEPREFHQLSVALCVARNLLKRPLFQSGNIVFHFDEKDETLLIINKKEFLKTIKDHLILFQYVLGPSITPELLFEAITSPGHSFCETLKYDRVLIGIVLGYGIQNALYQSRYENILCDLVVNEDTPPFIPNIAQLDSESSKEDLLFFEKNPRTKWIKERNFINPTYGFSSLDDELEKLSNQLAISSEKLQSSPYFIFGCLKDSKHNNLFIKNLEKTQAKIKQLLLSKSLVKDVLRLISNTPVEIEDSAIQWEDSSIDLNQVVAKLLTNGLREYDKNHFVYFLEGLKGEVDEVDLNSDILAIPAAVAHLKKGRMNLEEANSFFASLKTDSTLTEMLEDCLYYKVLNNGESDFLKGQTDVLVDYEVLDPIGRLLTSGNHVRLNLLNTLPAMIHGMQGMKTGEKRAIFIHPSLAYGVHTFLPKGIFLQIVVTLYNFYGTQHKLPPLIPSDLTFILKDELLQKCENEYNRALRFMGAQKREFLKSCPGLNIDEIAKKFQEIETISLPTEEESNALNQLFWKKYFQTCLSKSSHSSFQTSSRFLSCLGLDRESSSNASINK